MINSSNYRCIVCKHTYKVHKIFEGRINFCNACLDATYKSMQQCSWQHIFQMDNLDYVEYEAKRRNLI